MLKNRVEALEKAIPSADSVQFIWIRCLHSAGQEHELRACECLGKKFERGDETEDEFCERVQTFARAQPGIPGSHVLIAFESM